MEDEDDDSGEQSLFKRVVAYVFKVIVIIFMIVLTVIVHEWSHDRL